MLKTWLQTLASSMGVTLVGFIANVIIARSLGPEGRGLFGWAMLVATLTAGVAQLGLGQTFVYFKRTQAHWQWKQLLGLASFVVIALALVLATVGTALSANSARVSSLSLVTIAVALAINGLLINLSQLDVSLRAHNQARLAGPALFSAGLLAAWTSDALTVPTALWIQLAATTIASLALLSWVRSHFRPNNGTESHEPLLQQITKVSVHAFKLHGVVLLGMVLTNIDKLYLLTTGSLASFGLYTVAYTSSRLIGSVQETLSTTVYSRYAGDKSLAAGQNIQLAFQLTFAPMLVLAIALGLAGPLLLGTAFGEAFSRAGIVFGILLVECVLGNSSYLLAQQFNAAGRPGIVLARQVISLAPIIILLPMIPVSHPMEGIALVLLVSSFVRLMTTLLLFKFSLRLPIPRLLPSATELKKVSNRLGFKR